MSSRNSSSYSSSSSSSSTNRKRSRVVRETSLTNQKTLSLKSSSSSSSSSSLSLSLSPPLPSLLSTNNFSTKRIKGPLLNTGNSNKNHLNESNNNNSNSDENPPTSSLTSSSSSSLSLSLSSPSKQKSKENITEGDNVDDHLHENDHEMNRNRNSILSSYTSSLTDPESVISSSISNSMASTLSLTLSLPNSQSPPASPSPSPSLPPPSSLSIPSFYYSLHSLPSPLMANSFPGNFSSSVPSVSLQDFHNLSINFIRILQEQISFSSPILKEFFQSYHHSSHYVHDGRDLLSPSSQFPLSSHSILSLSQLLSPLDVSIIDHLWQQEETYQPAMNYLDWQQHLDSAMRPILVDWMSEVGQEFILGRETLQLAINYVDRFLTLNRGYSDNSQRDEANTNDNSGTGSGRGITINRANLQLLGVTSLFIAAKLEEIFPPNASDFATTTDGAYCVKQIELCEKEILRVLGWKLHPPTPFSWLKLFTKLISIQLIEDLFPTYCKYSLYNTKTLEHSHPSCLHGQFSSSLMVLSSLLSDLLRLNHFLHSSHLIDLCLMDMESLHYYPSAIAAAALFITFSHLTPLCKMIEKCSGYNMKTLQPCMELMINIMQANNKKETGTETTGEGDGNKDEHGYHFGIQQGASTSSSPSSSSSSSSLSSPFPLPFPSPFYFPFPPLNLSPLSRAFFSDIQIPRDELWHRQQHFSVGIDLVQKKLLGERDKEREKKKEKKKNANFQNKTQTNTPIPIPIPPSIPSSTAITVTSSSSSPPSSTSSSLSSSAYYSENVDPLALRQFSSALHSNNDPVATAHTITSPTAIANTTIATSNSTSTSTPTTSVTTSIVSHKAPSSHRQVLRNISSSVLNSVAAASTSSSTSSSSLLLPSHSQRVTRSERERRGR